MENKIVQVEEKLPILQTIPLSLQHLFAMFGATVLVPILFKINPAIALLFNGIGTLIYLYICSGKIPAYLGSSFAFIAPVLLVSAQFGYGAALSGFIVNGLIFMIVAGLVYKYGTNWINIILPPAAMGTIVAIIGLELAPVAIGMAGFSSQVISWPSIIVSSFTILVTIIASLTFRGFFRIIPVLIGVVSGYLLALFMGMVDFTPVTTAAWFSMPTFYTPEFNLSAILIILPASLVVIAEHIGHLVVTGNIVGKDLIKDPGLNKSLFADGISNVLSGFFGSPPNTTYGENIGVMAITKVYSTWVIGGAAVIAIALSFIGKLAALILSIPVPVMGGVCILLFGVIAASGIRMLIETKIDYSKARNLILTSVPFIVGLGGAKIPIGAITLQGMALAAVVAVVLSLFIALLDKLKLTSE